MFSNSPTCLLECCLRQSLRLNSAWKRCCICYIAMLWLFSLFQVPAVLLLSDLFGVDYGQIVACESSGLIRELLWTFCHLWSIEVITLCSTVYWKFCQIIIHIFFLNIHGYICQYSSIIWIGDSVLSRLTTPPKSNLKSIYIFFLQFIKQELKRMQFH